MSNFAFKNNSNDDDDTDYISDFVSLDEIEECYDFEFDESDKEHVNLILDIFNDKINPTNTLLSESKDGYIEYIFGLYYNKEKENDEKMIKYYKMAAEKGNVSRSTAGASWSLPPIPG